MDLTERANATTANGGNFGGQDELSIQWSGCLPYPDHIFSRLLSGMLHR